MFARVLALTSRPLCWSCLLLAAVLAGAGCGKKGPASTVSGKVTLNGKPVAGTVTFIGPDNREITAPINPDGTYTVANPPAGQVQVVVRNLPGARPGMTPSIPRNVSMPGNVTSASVGLPPPMRYAWQNNGLAFSVTGGKQQHDIILTP
jgi:hypothetical protein